MVISVKIANCIINKNPGRSRELGRNLVLENFQIDEYTRIGDPPT